MCGVTRTTECGEVFYLSNVTKPFKHIDMVQTLLECKLYTA